MTSEMNARALSPRPITIAVVALGGEGGGVLADWIVDLAQHGGYLAQATSVPGVAQRTGATVYYVELFPKAQAGGREPVLALMPMPGDVDVVLASELMEAARAVERGFVTPDKTLLIASTHRVFAMTEKIALADGREDAAALLAACRDAARELVAFDMAALADATGSVMSAVTNRAFAAGAAISTWPCRSLRMRGISFSRSSLAASNRPAGPSTAVGRPTDSSALVRVHSRSSARRADKNAARAKCGRKPSSWVISSGSGIPRSHRRSTTTAMRSPVGTQMPVPAPRPRPRGRKNSVNTGSALVPSISSGV